MSAPSGIGNVQFADALGLSEELTEHLESAGSGDTLRTLGGPRERHT